MVQSQGVEVPDVRLGIGEVAKRAGVTVDTVRFYERRGILAPSERSAAGYRRFGPSAVDRIQLTHQLSRLGMTLREIAAALQAAEHGADCSTERWRLELVRDRLDAKIAELQAARHDLARVIASCEACDCVVRVPGG